MSQTTPTPLAAEVESLGAADLLPFLELLDADMIGQALAAEKVRCNDCIYTPIVTLALFLSQAIDPDHSCRAAVARLIAWRTRMSSNGLFGPSGIISSQSAPPQ